MQIAGLWIKDNSKTMRDYLNEVILPRLEKLLGEQYRIISTWLITLYTTYAPIVVQSAHELYTWLSMVIPEIYNYIITKIYELSLEFLD